VPPRDRADDAAPLPLGELLRAFAHRPRDASGRERTGDARRARAARRRRLPARVGERSGPHERGRCTALPRRRPQRARRRPRPHARIHPRQARRRRRRVAAVSVPRRARARRRRRRRADLRRPLRHVRAVAERGRRRVRARRRLPQLFAARALTPRSMPTLHYHPGNASLIAHVVLEEIGAPFALEFVDRAQAAHKSKAYLALNPNGLIPVLVDETAGGPGAPLVLYETAAVCIHLADMHPEAALLPPLATAERATAYKWIVWLSNTLQPALIVYFYPERWADDDAGAAAIRAKAESKIAPMLDQLD